MLDEGRSPSQVVRRVTAVRAAMNGVVQVVIDDLVADRTRETARDQPFQDRLLELQKDVIADEGWRGALDGGRELDPDRAPGIPLLFRASRSVLTTTGPKNRFWCVSGRLDV
jgi:hypothetical protein